MFRKVIINLVFVSVVAIFVTGCGPYLGDHKFQEAEIVDIQFLEQVDPNFSHGLPMSELFRIVFTSTTDLEAASEGHSLYIDADFCPFKDRRGIGVIGPYYDDKSRYGPIRESRRQDKDGRVVIFVESDNISPKVNERTGEFIYTAYVIPYRNPPRFKGGGNIILNPYDIRTDNRDICFRLFSPGYYITPSQSNIFRISRSEIDALLNRRE